MGAGRLPVSSAEIEEDIELGLLARARINFPRSKREMLELIGEFIKTNKMSTRFKNEVPGE